MKWYERQKSLFESGNKDSIDALKDRKIEDEEMFEKKNEELDVDYSVEETITDGFRNLEVTNITTIHKQTVLNGDITLSDDLVVYGTIKGNIKSEKNITIYGNVEGTITCQNAILDSADIIGDITCGDSMQLSEATVVYGNVKASTLLSGGKIKGNTVVTDIVHLLSTAAILGDVTCGDIEIERGSFLEGNVKVTKSMEF